MLRMLCFFAALLVTSQSQADATFTLTSSDIAPSSTIGNAHVYKGYGCKGDNRSPSLSWSGAPSGTHSFAVGVFDPDAPTSHGWWHWLVVDLPATATSLPAGAGDAEHPQLPSGSRQLRNDFGAMGYGGPCPPPGAPHRYVFTVYALKVARLDLPADASAASVEAALRLATLDQTSFTAHYSR